MITFNNIKLILEECGSCWENIVDVELNSNEKELFSKSADAVRKMNDALKTL